MNPSHRNPLCPRGAFPWPRGATVSTRPFQGRNTGSIPVGATNPQLANVMTASATLSEGDAYLAILRSFGTASSALPFRPYIPVFARARGEYARHVFDHRARRAFQNRFERDVELLLGLFGDSFCVGAPRAAPQQGMERPCLLVFLPGPVPDGLHEIRARLSVILGNLLVNLGELLRGNSETECGSDERSVLL